MTFGRSILKTRIGRGAVMALVLAVGSAGNFAYAQAGSDNNKNTDSPDSFVTNGDNINEDGFPGDPGMNGEDIEVNRPQTEQGVHVSEYMTVDLFVQDEDLANVLQMLSLQTQKNIVASRDVNARVTANLYGVTFYEALDSILNVNGYGYIEKGNFIYVHTLEELEQMQQEQRELVHKVIQLNYLNANDAAEFVVPLLSDAGSIKTNGDVGEFTIPEDSPTGNEEFALAATLVIYDYAENIGEIESLLSELDTRPAQVLVEATILQTQVNEANAWGIDFAVINDLDFTDFFGFGGARNVVGSIIDDKVTPSDNEGVVINSLTGNTSGPGTLKLGIIQDDIGLFIRMLDEVSDVSILSNPKILALNRQPARVLVGRKLGFLNTTSTQTATTQTVEFLDTGTQLSFRPFISKDGNIRLELKPRVSEGVIREASDATGAAVTIPDEITQEITTNVIVPDGSTVVLGGLFKETTMLSRRQIPILGDIPIIGAAFKGHDDDVVREEIIFMIKPTIVSDEVLLDEGDRALAETERVRTGSRRGLLPWSRERQTARLNMKASDAARRGDISKALWHLRRSLELNPNQADAIRLREQLGGKIERWPTRTILDEIITGEATVQAMNYIESLGGRSSASKKSGEEMVDASTSEGVEFKNDTTGFSQEKMDQRIEKRQNMNYDPLFDEPSRYNNERDDNAFATPNSPDASVAVDPEFHTDWFMIPDEIEFNDDPFGGDSDLDDGNWRDTSDVPPASSREPQVNAQQSPFPSHIASLITDDVKTADWTMTMGDSWMFAHPIPMLPFGLFWTAGGFEPTSTVASPAEFMTDVLTTVEPGFDPQD